ncbi:urotensin 2 domain containing [Paramisgurnus dabryanus]|uniref:urotensin 2 domain containing n=1 Tax=Paramisgurnus dabryanus TaxID=90735 RepID=UPI0031F3A3A1
MDVVPSGSFFPRLLALIFLISVLEVQTRSLASPVNQVYQLKDDSDVQSKILAYLLRKNIPPAKGEDVMGLELASKIAELHEIAALQEQFNLERQLMSNAIETERSIPKKRNDACFWKYCV